MIHELKTMKIDNNNTFDNNGHGNDFIADVSSSDLLNTTTGIKSILPLEMRWQPKEDITTYELAKCLPYLLRSGYTMPYEIDKTENHFRHFEIIDHNQ